jgi:hypothetical protein
MSYILKRSDFIRNQKLSHSYSIDEALANEINWGDSLIGRMLNSMMRKASIGIDLIKIDKVIERLKTQFEILKDQIKIKQDTEAIKKLFYVAVSQLLGMLIVEISNTQTSKDEIIKIAKSIRNDINNITPPEDEEVKKDKLELLDKLKEFIDKIEGDETQKPSDEKTTEVEVVDTSNKERDKIKNLITLYVNQLDSEDPENKEIIALSKSNNITSEVALKDMDKIQVSTNVSDQNKDEESKFSRLLEAASALIKYLESEIKSGVNEEQYKKFIEKINKFKEKQDWQGLSEYLLYVKFYFQSQESKKQNTNQKALAQTNDSYRYIKDYSQFIKESNLVVVDTKDSNVEAQYTPYEEVPNNKDENKQDSKKIEQEEKNIKVIFEEIFTKEYMKKYDFDEADKDKLNKEIVSNETTSITIDPIIEILKIFNRAYKIHTPGIISSGRTGGKVSNSVFREYEYVGDGTGGTPDSPGAGPYRNKAIFDKWESAVLDIIKDPEYQQIFNEKTYFHFSPSDPRFNTSENKKEGGGKALLKFINELLDGGKLYKTGAQQKFISEYFDVEVDSKKLGYTPNETGNNAKIAKDQKTEEKLKFLSWDSIKENKVEINMIFKRKSKDSTWYFKILEAKEGEKVFFLLSEGFPYNLKLEESVHLLSSTGNLWIGCVSSKEFRDNQPIKLTKRLQIEEKEKIDDFTKGGEISFGGKLFVLCKQDGSIFKESSNMKEAVHKKLIDNWNNLKDKNTDWKKAFNTGS